jgi:hypothetical protein
LYRQPPAGLSAEQLDLLQSISELVDQYEKTSKVDIAFMLSPYNIALLQAKEEAASWNIRL